MEELNKSRKALSTEPNAKTGARLVGMTVTSGIISALPPFPESCLKALFKYM